MRRAVLAVVLVMYGCSAPRVQTAPPITQAKTVPTTASADGSSDTVLLGAARPRGTWVLTTSALTYRTSQGEPASTQLPVGVEAADVADVEVIAGDEVWLARANAADGAVHVYRKHANDPWQGMLMTPIWPADVPIAGAPAVSFADTPSDIVAVVATAVLGTSTALSNLFITRDDGKSFRTISFDAQDPLNVRWSSVVMPSPNQIVVIGGPVSQLVFASEDAGASWASQTIAGLPSGATIYSIGAPVTLGTRVLLPVFSNNDADNEILTLAEEMPGKELTPATGIAQLRLSDTFNGGFLLVAASSNSVWVVAADGKTIFKTTLGQNSWDPEPASGLPDNVMSIRVTDEMHADAIGIGSSSTYTHYTTSDGGHSWALSF